MDEPVCAWFREEMMNVEGVRLAAAIVRGHEDELGTEPAADLLAKPHDIIWSHQTVQLTSPADR
jgi:hypothetical protein